jgi:hypothetical protein
MAHGWEGLLDAEVADGTHRAFRDDLGPAILGDAKAFVPVDTGRLEGSLDMDVDDSGRMPVLIVGSFPDAEGEVEYAAAVELGFHGPETVRAHMRRTSKGEVPVREHERQGNTPEQPYLRPALYQERDI